MKKKGFTLVELLAVIIILAVIALIATPIVLNAVEKARESARLQSVNGLIDAAELYVAEAMLNDNISLEGNLLESVQERTDGRKPETGEILYDKSLGIGVAVEYDGYYYLKGYYDSVPSKIDADSCTVYKVVEDTCYEVDSMISYDINYDNCVSFFEGAPYTEDEVDLLCKGESTESGETFEDVVKEYGLTDDSLISAGVVENIVYGKACKSCFTTAEISDSYELNYEGCKKQYVESAETEPTEEELAEIEILCSGGTTSDGYNLKDEIDEMIETSPSYISLYKNMGVIDYVGDVNSIITGYNCYEGNSYGFPVVTDVVIPTVINGNYVTGIGDYTFREKNLTSVDFSGAAKLYSLGTWAFTSNQISGELDLSNSRLKTIGGFAFADNQVTSVKFPTTLETIGNNIFYNNQISELDLSNTKLTQINMQAFMQNQLLSIKLPNSLEFIDEDAFRENQITSVDLSNTKVISIGERSFKDNQIQLLELSPVIETIERYTFENNQIMSLELPTSVKTIEDYAFIDNQISGKLDLSNTKLIEISEQSFSGNKIESVKLPVALTTIGSYAFQNNQISGELDLRYLDKLTTIEYGAFKGNQINKIYLSSGIENISTAVFFKTNASNPYLSLIVNPTGRSFDWGTIINNSSGDIFPTGVVTNEYGNVNVVTEETATESSCFTYENSDTGIIITDYTCTGSYVNIPDTIDNISIVGIGDNAFESKGIINLYLPDTIQFIGSYAFSENRILEIVLPTSLKEIGSYAFYNNGITGSLNLQDLHDLETIGEYAFNGNQISGEMNLSELNKLVMIDEGAFTNNQITFLKLPSSIETIGDLAFRYNMIEGNLDLKNTKLTEISFGSFANNQIESIEFPNSIQKINRAAFATNQISGELDLSDLVNLTSVSGFTTNQIESVKLPSSIKEIDAGAFNKTDMSNPDLTTIVNPTGLSFDWSSITRSSTSDQNFVTGTITHQNGNITVTDK